MQESGVHWELTWERAALVLGVILTFLGIMSKGKSVMAWAGRRMTALFVWAGRRAIMSLLATDSQEVREYIAGLFEEELRRGEQVRKLIQQLEDEIVETRREVDDNRKTIREDVASWGARVQNEMRQTRSLFQKTVAELSAEQRRTNRVLHTVLGYVAGPEKVREELKNHLHNLDKFDDGQV